MLNLFRPESVPEAAESVSDDAKKWITWALIPHIVFLSAGIPERTEILTNWIAHQVQRPGVLLRWAPLIQGEQGVGKTFVRKLMISLIGRENVGVVDADHVISKNRSWANQHQVVFLEELKVSGKNRYAVVNSLKPLITDDQIRLEEKYQASWEATNYTNYFALTNSKEAIPMTADDRRWCIFFTPPRDHMSESGPGYYDRLFGGLTEFGTELRRYFLDMEIPESFSELRTAPMTESKKSMIATSNCEQGLDDLLDLIHAGGMGYCDTVVRIPWLFEAYAQINGDIVAPYEQKLRLKKLGYTAHPKTVRWKGGVIRVWVNQEMSNEEIKREMNDKWVSRGENLKISQVL